MAEFRTWATQWGDIASVLGVLLTILGFTATIIGVWRSKSAAEQASEAAAATRQSMAHYDAIADLSSATAIMDEIKRLQRYRAWAVLPDRYSELRRRLVTIKASNVQVTETQRQTLQATVETFADLERRIEHAVAVNTAPPNPAKLNDIVSAQIDEVQVVLLSLQRALRERHE
jgi:hypothetical protein